MPQISRKRGKTLLDISAGAISMQKASNSESTTKIVEARSAAIELTTQARLPAQRAERLSDVVLVQSSVW